MIVGCILCVCGLKNLLKFSYIDYYKLRGSQQVELEPFTNYIYGNLNLT
jgi:hypothetical protein